MPAVATRARHTGAWVGGGLAGVLVVAGFLGLDRWFYEHVSLALNTEGIDRDFYHATQWLWWFFRAAFGYGLAGVVLGVVVIVLEPGRWRGIVAALLAVVVAGLLANVAQGAIGRLRPNQADTHLAFVPPFSELLTKQRVSFPSGEAATGLALACVLSRLFPRWRLVFYVGGALAAGARLVNGAHYLSDVAAGGLVGVLVADFVFRALRRHLINPAALSPAN
jgi:membrane-associated phospholipid phosphatase